MSSQQPDSLRAVLDRVFAAPDYHWVQRTEHLAWIRRTWLHIKVWWQQLEDTHPVVYNLIVIALVAAMLAIVVRAAWSFARSVRDTEPAGRLPGATASRHDQEWYRREADRLASMNRFAEAIQADFLSLVLTLDARQQLRFHPSKTPAEYARESRFESGAREDFRDLVRRLYAYAFARVPCGATEFADWRERAVAERYAPAN